MKIGARRGSRLRCGSRDRCRPSRRAMAPPPARPPRDPPPPRPAASTVPTTWWPGTSGSFGSGSSPSTTCRSVRHTPHARTFTSTSPGAGSGTGSSRSSSGRDSTGAAAVQHHRPHAGNSSVPLEDVVERVPLGRPAPAARAPPRSAVAGRASRRATSPPCARSTPPSACRRDRSRPIAAPRWRRRGPSSPSSPEGS